MGMTLTAANALLGGSMTVVNAKTPEFGKLIAVQDWEGLDRLFLRVIRHALLLVLVGAVAGFIAIWLLQAHFNIGNRFIPAAYAALLFGTACFQAVAGAFANYLRAHKKEPLMRMTIIASILQGSATWYLGKHYGVPGVTAGFFAVTAFFVFPYVLIVWRRCRREWHGC
jgi:O-antigen/teichoic acid export membrane protein